MAITQDLESQDHIMIFNKAFPVGSTVNWRVTKGEDAVNVTVSCPAYVFSGTNGNISVFESHEIAGFLPIKQTLIDYGLIKTK
jgi:hypothetical protein